MQDLLELNRRIAAHVGEINANVASSLSKVSICIGRLKPSGEQLIRAIAEPRMLSGENSLDVVSINREYLSFCRLVSRDIIHGHYDGLVVLDCDLQQANLLANMTTQQINDISRYWPGTIFSPIVALSCRPEAFHDKAIVHYPTALLAG